VKRSDKRSESVTFSKGLRPFETPEKKKARPFSRFFPALQGGTKKTAIMARLKSGRSGIFPKKSFDKGTGHFIKAIPL
jgi:hypothetical protein